MNLRDLFPCFLGAYVATAFGFGVMLVKLLERVPVRVPRHALGVRKAWHQNIPTLVTVSLLAIMWPLAGLVFGFLYFFLIKQERRS